MKKGSEKKVMSEKNVSKKTFLKPIFSSLSKYPFVKVKIRNDKGLCCGTSLFYNYLVETFKNPILSKRSVITFVELVREKDTWQFTELESAFPVVIGRNVTDVAANLQIVTNDTVGAFEMDSVVSFKAGQEIDTLWITCKLGYGESYALTIDVPEEYATAYGQPTVTINVLVDFTWLPSGTVVYQSGFWGGAQAKVPIEQAKEYTDALNSVTIDLQLLGIGGNGHIGFNEPGTVLFVLNCANC